MSDRFIDLEHAAIMISSNYSTETVLEKINNGELTAYVRIYCEDEDEVHTRYEIAVIKNVRQCSQNNQKDGNTWYVGDCFPFEALQDDEYEYHRANIASDENFGERVFNNLKRNLPNSYVTVDQICLLHFDVLKFIQKIAKIETADLHGVGSTENESVVCAPETPEQFICRLRLSGEQNEVIAVLLNKNFPRRQLAEYMKLIDPAKVKRWEENEARVGRPKQWFYDLRTAGLKILADRENMTPSEIRDLPS